MDAVPIEGAPAGHRQSRGVALGAWLLAALLLGILADVLTGWFEQAFDVVAHLFYEQPVLAAIRRPSQIPLARAHAVVLVLVSAAGCVAAPRLDRHWRGCWAAFAVAYAIRAVIWTAGGNLPLVPGDSSHYVEVATSVFRGEGPVKHYVESFFVEYPEIRAGRGTLDDWATPLYAYVLAWVYRLVGIIPGNDVETTFAVAKGTSFVLNLLCLPALYCLARRVYGRHRALVAVWLLTILPVHAIYAGLELRESLVALTSIAAVWAVIETWQAQGSRAVAYGIGAGVVGGLAILARNTSMAILAAAAISGLVPYWRTRHAAMVAWGLAVLATIAPWAWMTWVAYGEPFFTYTKFFKYTFSWAVHHYQTGAPTAAEFFTVANAPEIARVKIKSLLIIAVYSTMILGPALVVAVASRWSRVRQEGSPIAIGMDRLSGVLAIVFVLGTLASTSDVTQVAQLGRYYLPLFCLLLPTAAAGLSGWMHGVPSPRPRWVAGGMLVTLLWANPRWAYDTTWLVQPFQLHLPALRAAGEWMRQHPAEVSPDARVMTWFPWEMRLLGQRTTILMPRSFDARRNLQTIGDGPFGYHVTHVLWGSFEPPPHVDPELFGPYLDRVRIQTGLTDAKEIYRSPPGMLFPVRLYRVREPGQ